MTEPSRSDDVIFESLVMPNLTLKNRILRSSVGGMFDHYDGTGTTVRINWDARFAAGGVGAVISSFAPVDVRGRVAPSFAAIDRDDRIPFWRELGERIHTHDCAYIVQLAHSGRQRDIHGVENRFRPAQTATAGREPVHGLSAETLSVPEIRHIQELFGAAARRALQAGLDGVEVHAAHGYLFTQFLSPVVNRRNDAYGGDLQGRARFLLETIRAIRAAVGADFHLQVKLNAFDQHDAVVPGSDPGSTLDEAIVVAQWLADEGVDALHVSAGDSFPHPLNPPGDLPVDELARGYGPLFGQADHALRNYVFFRLGILHRVLRWAWRRGRKGRPVEASWLAEAAAIRREVDIPVICVGGFQRASTIRSLLGEGLCDAVAIARPLVANNDLVDQFRAGKELPDRPCSFCNRCLYNIVTHPMGCYDVERFDGDHDAMVDTIMSVYEGVT